MIEWLKRHYAVEMCLIDLHAELPYAPLKNCRGDFHILVCWQVMPPVQYLTKLITYRHAAFFPMADGAPSIHKPEKWYPYRRFNIISFSKALYKQLREAGYQAHYFQYYPQPARIDEWGNPDSVFLWARREAINIDTVQRLLESGDAKHVHVHKVPDPGETFAEPHPKCKLRFTYSTWFADREDLDQVIQSSACYMAPRPREGIGMSFLEAMAMGRCVIAPNTTTMNEYIKHGVNGLLYDLDKPQPLGTFDTRKIQKNAAESIHHGYKRWLIDRELIIGCMSSRANYSMRKIAMRMALRAIKNPLKVVRSVLGD